jgi:putative hemolysin
MIEFLILVLCLIWLSAIFSGSEIALYGVNRVKLRYQLDQGNRRARAVRWMITPIGPTIIAVLIGNNIVAQLLAMEVERRFAFLGWGSVLVTTFVLTPVVLLFGEFLPKHLFYRRANTVVFKLAYVLFALRVLLTPAVWLFLITASAIRRMVGTPVAPMWEPHTSRHNLRNFLKAEADGTALSPVQRFLVDRIMAMETISIAYSKVTKPLTTIAALDASSRIGEVREHLGPTYFTRYLVTSGDSGTPVGWVSATRLVTGEAAQRIENIAQPVMLISDDTSLAEALQRMHAKGCDLALVTDRSGRRILGVAFRSDCLRALINIG